jgi:hypothetical protein
MTRSIRTNVAEIFWPRRLNSAVTTQALLALYLQIVEWIPLGRWNNVANGNGQESTDITLAVLQTAILLFFWRRWRWAMIAGSGLYCIWLYLEISSLWVPYIRGASPSTMRFYNHWFANTFKILPPIGNKEWNIQDRVMWLQMAAMAFQMAYGSVGPIEINSGDSQ